METPKRCFRADFFNEHSFEAKLRLLFGSRAHLFLEADGPGVLRLALEGWAGLRNGSFHFVGRSGFVRALRRGLVGSNNAGCGRCFGSRRQTSGYGPSRAPSAPRLVAARSPCRALLRTETDRCAALCCDGRCTGERTPAALPPRPRPGGERVAARKDSASISPVPTIGRQWRRIPDGWPAISR